MKKLLVILGSTATGKTSLAIKLAKKFNGEIVSADSRQVYKKLDIGTGKLISNFLPFSGEKVKNLDIGTGKIPGSGKWQVNKKKGFWEINGIKIWMYDTATFKTQYTVADFVKRANKVIAQIWDKGKLPILVGGTGLYLRAITEGLSNLQIPLDRKLRKELENLPKNQLQSKLRKISPKKWGILNQSDKENPRRLVRAIELAISVDNNNTAVALMSTEDHLIKKTDVLKIGLTAPRDFLYKRADESVVLRIKNGMIEETMNLQKEGLTLKRMKQLGLEYGVLADYLDDKVKNKIELIKILQGKIHGFVRRQLTWFKKEKDVKWFDISDKSFLEKVEELVGIWYDSLDAYQN